MRAWPELDNILPLGQWSIARHAFVHGLRASIGDVIFCSGGAGKVTACLYHHTSDRYFALIDHMQHVRADLFILEAPRLIPLEDIKGVAIWKSVDARHMCVLLPGAMAWESRAAA